LGNLKIRRTLKRMIHAYNKDTEGTVSIEFVLWLPVFLLFILVTADLSLVFTRQSNQWSISHETARILSRHGMTAADAQDYVENQARFSGYTPKVEIEVTDSDVTVIIIAKAQKMAPFGTLGFALGNTITTKVKQTLEPI